MTEAPEPDRVAGCPHPNETTQLLGHAHAQAALYQAAQSGAMHHAWMITGPKGIGKATLAYQAARYLLAEERGGFFGPSFAALPDVPEDHPVSTRMRAGSEPGLYVLKRPLDDKGEKLRAVITVDETRKLKHFFSMAASGNGRRIVIVDAVDDLNVSAANALLKVLEEPPADAVMFLITHQPAKVLPTIRSRCRVLPLRPLDDENLRQALSIAIPGESLEQGLFALAQGSVGRAAQLMQGDGLQLYANLVGILAEAPNLDRQKLLSLADTYGARNKPDALGQLTDMISVLMSRMALSAVTAPHDQQACKGERDMFAKLCPSHQAAQIWAEAQQKLEGELRQGASVNLDPPGLILDMALKLEETAAQVMR